MWTIVMGSKGADDLSETISTHSSGDDLQSWTAVCVQVERVDQVDSALCYHLDSSSLRTPKSVTTFRPDSQKVFIQLLVSHPCSHCG